MQDILKQLPTKAKQLYDSTFESAKNTYSSERAHKIALKTVANKFVKVEELWTAKYEELIKYTNVKYVFEADAQSVSKDLEGAVYRDYVLSSINKDKHGEAFSDFALKRMTEQINEEGLVGRADKSHSLWKELSEKGLSPQEIEEELQLRDTGIKAVSARYEQGRLIAKVKFSPDAYADAKDYKGASIEARIPETSYRAGVYHQARLQGFVLTNSPANLDAVAL